MALILPIVSSKENARRLRRDQTEEEKQLWRALRGRQFAGFKFRRQHINGDYTLDFYCAEAKLAVELDGFHHGMPEEIQNDKIRTAKLAEENIEIVRFWNHQWRNNRNGCLLEIWNTIQRRTGVVQIVNREEQKFVAPNVNQIQQNKDDASPPEP